MNTKKHVIVYDPIPFHGGSKVATSWAMQVAGNHVHYHILTADPQSWNELMSSHQNMSLTKIMCPAYILKQAYGLGYWTKQAFMSLYLMSFYLLVFLRTGFTSLRLILASGPSVDFAGYVLAYLANIPVIQLIHGNIGGSRAARWCLNQGHETFYLDSAKGSITNVFKQPLHGGNFHSFVNGLPKKLWPSERNQATFNDNKPSVFWSASLLKWKGLDLLVEAMEHYELDQQISCSICYIKPKQTLVEQSELPISSQHVQLFHQPANLDEIRASSDIFVSTSHKEPFGLAILEALAAGLIVVIPKDNAYWDKHLTCGLNCFKYQPNDPVDLARTLEGIAQNIHQYQSIATAGKQFSTQYRAEKTYKDIAKSIEGDRNEVIQSA